MRTFAGLETLTARRDSDVSIWFHQTFFAGRTGQGTQYLSPVKDHRFNAGRTVDSVGEIAATCMLLPSQNGVMERQRWEGSRPELLLRFETLRTADGL